MNDEIRPRPGILDIAPYQGGASRIAGRDDVLKLSSNESAWGPSPAALAAFAASAGALHRYPDGSHADLRAAIGEAQSIDPERVVCGAGSDELIALLCQAYAGPGNEVVHTEHGFALYRIATLAAGATPVRAPERSRAVDVDALLAACGPATRLVFIANPGNPTGTLLGPEALARLAGGLPPRAMLVLDGAYAEFAEGYDGGAALVAARENVVMLRTFSKLHGLGGLRIGWGFAPGHVVDALNRVRGPFNLSTTQQATAAAAMRDRDWAAQVTAETRAMRARLAEGLDALGIAADESHANFLMARFASTKVADAVEAHLRGEAILVRKVGNYGFPEALRITVGDAPSVERVLGALAGFRALAA